MTIYPDISDFTLYGIEEVYTDPKRFRYEAGEILISKLLPGLQTLLNECAVQVAENAHAELPLVGRGIAKEFLLHKLADFLTLAEHETANVARPAWLADSEMVREVLTLPTLDDYRESKTQPKPKPAPESDEEGDQDEESRGDISPLNDQPTNIIDLPGYPSIEAVS